MLFSLIIKSKFLLVTFTFLLGNHKIGVLMVLEREGIHFGICFVIKIQVLLKLLRFLGTQSEIMIT